MIVKITYDDQRLDIFDTAAFTASVPFGKDCLLANFEVRFDLLGDDGLWVAAHSYQADKSVRQEEGSIPVARRKRGWRFLLATAEELEHVELVVVDGEAIIKRVLGELVDLQAFDEAAYECTGSSSKGLHERIADLHGYLSKVKASGQVDVPGVPDSVLEKVLNMQTELSNADEDEEDWGDVNEIGW